eukprot:scaffold551_cov395-Prasinococcus_capsulatus_cf.AAC.17
MSDLIATNYRGRVTKNGLILIRQLRLHLQGLATRTRHKAVRNTVLSQVSQNSEERESSTNVSQQG